MNNIDLDKDFIHKDDLVVKTKTYLFLPSEGKEMKIEYPELAEIAEFAPLTNSELILVWCIANNTSPYFLGKAENVESKMIEFVKKALEISGVGKRLNDYARNEYLTFMFPQKIKTACSRMKLFKPSLRMRAKMMNEKMFENMEKMVEISQEEMKEMTPSEKLEYLKIVKSASENLQTLVPEIESSYGVKEAVKKSGAQLNAQATIMDLILAGD